MHISLYMRAPEIKKMNEVRGFKVCGHCFGIHCTRFIFLELREAFYGSARSAREGKNIFVSCQESRRNAFQTLRIVFLKR